ncbi:LANO_0H01728g1_1 [Lachancea nothofagi CBS 11611]|uniref:LANO_0H01728g1_1 n=1 Tax=Lachancea nothofagi CBS 11611 TaxID=1266666 RepID=A0A1G4KL78_9SACH|nr:LANO_0H01728g1_1 [Lachancea nothofagi CBS 11611]
MGHSIEDELTPDIIEAALPYLSIEDIKNLSLTNKYFHKLLDFEKSDTLWHELFRKSFGSMHSDAEPLESKENAQYMSCCEAILRNRFPDESWGQLYRKRALNATFHTWGSLKHARLGFTAVSHGSLPIEVINNAGMRLQFGINAPVPVPWYSSEEGQSQPFDDKSIASVSAGGFSFQILTKSGKLYSTGSTYSGGHRGPGTVEGEHDYNPFQELIVRTERSLALFNGRTPRAGGVVPINTTSSMPLERPHENIYARLEDVEQALDQKVLGNKHVRRLFARDVLNVDPQVPHHVSVESEELDKIKFQALSSGRSHFLALSTEGELYSWDGPDVEQGIRIVLERIPVKTSNPIVKIGCGWNYNCVSVYKIGLVVWSSRSATKENEPFATANYKIIPNTGEVSGDDKVVDFACCANMCVFFITANGDQLKLYANGEMQNVDLPLDGKLVKIVGCYTMLAIFTTRSCYTVNVVDGQILPQSLIRLELEDNEDMFISLSTGDYHTIALTSKGKMYTWGLESELCGCLGLGNREEIVNARRIGRIENLRSTRVIKPSLVKLANADYVCLAVTAGGWQTGALILS